MNVGVYPYPHGDPLLIDKIVNEFLSQGKFDKLRKECMSDADTKPAYQNLQQRVENTVTQFLKKQVWRPDLNKNQLRDSLRKHILESKFFDAGISRIVDQVVNPNVLGTVFLPEVEEVVYSYLSIPRPFDKNQKRDERVRSSGKDIEHKKVQENHKSDKYGRERSEGSDGLQKENHSADEDHKSKEILEKASTKDYGNPNEVIKTEPQDETKKAEEKIKSEPEEEIIQEKPEVPSDESQESLNRMEGLHINEPEAPPVPDSDDSAPLEINEKSMSESRDSEDSIMNQMSPISQGRLTPDLEEELPEVKLPEEKPEEKPAVKEEEKKPLTFIGRIPKIKREDSESSKSSKPRDDTPKREKLDVKHVYSSDESDSSKSYGKSDSDEKRRKSEKSSREERKRDDSEKKHKDRKRDGSKDGKSSKDRSHKDHRRERSRERHKKTSASSSSSQRERSSSHHKSTSHHRHKDSKSRRKEEEKKKGKSTDDHGKERNKKEDRRSTDRDSNERERGRSSGTSRTDGENRKREKEQTKTEETKGEQGQNEEMEKESDRTPETDKTTFGGQMTPTESPEGQNDSDAVLDFQELLRLGALARVQFPKLTDDFYVKFNSTGFRYFEDWEQSKLDCEEEFKEFVDEAENDLSLLSDDDSDVEMEKKFKEENDKTIKNLLKGLGNFRRSVMFDPNKAEFYKWTNNKFYQKFRKKGESREGSTEKTESDESIKENIDRGGETRRALHQKLINRYRRKAMRMGKPRRRQRKPGWGGIKEKNENAVFSKVATEEEEEEEEEKAFRRVMLVTDCSLVESENSAVPNGVNSLSNLYGGEGVSLPESPEESEDWSRKQSGESGKKNGDGKLAESLPLHLPPSPDSDDIDTSNGIGSNSAAASRKRVNKTEGGTPKKQTRRNYSQKYESQDLYKPRPILNGSRTRGRERGLVDSGSPVLR